MLNSQEFEANQRRNTEQRRAMIKRWAEYVHTHDDEEWSRQQNRLIDIRRKNPRLKSCLLPTNRVAAEVNKSDRNLDIYRFNTPMERFC